MANENDIANEIIKTKGLHLVPVKGQPFLEERLKAGFIWQRVKDLLASVGEANIRQRIDAELATVGTYLDIRVGKDRKSGTFFTRAPGSSDTNNLLDLADLALQRVSGNEPGKVKQRTAAAIDTRSKSVLMIVWRAVVFEAQVLWRSSPTLDFDALDELLDRRLRVVERMRYQIGDRGAMVRDNNAKFNFDRNAATVPPGSKWFDDLRVRLFEYMSFNSRKIFDIPGLPSNTWAPVKVGTITVAANYVVLRTGSRTLDGVLVSGSPADAWRMPADVADKWQVSLATPGFNEIDFFSQTPFNPGPVLDSLFDYRGTLAGGEPRKSDLWNRAWLLCDQVLASLHLEALLFALRRRPGVSNPENVLQTLVQKRPTVTVTFEGPQGTHTFDTAFVALGGRVRKENQFPGTETVLMMSDKPLTDPFGDPYFRNELTSLDGVQVGDQIKFLNATPYAAITSNQGIWKLENALVMEVEPAADNAFNRMAVDIRSVRFQGHGTGVETYDSMRQTLGHELDKLLVGIYLKVLRAIAIQDTVFYTNAERDLDVRLLNEEIIRVFRWAPFPEINKLKFGLPFVDDKGNEGLQFLDKDSAPWWIALPFGRDSVADALAGSPHAIGGPNVTAAGAADVPRLPEFVLDQGKGFFTKYIAFPLFEPVLAADEEIPGRAPWVAYFLKRQQIGAHQREFRSLNGSVDVSLIPGLFVRQTTGVLKRKFGVLRPRARAAP